MTSINFDHISANPLLPEVKEAMIAAINHDYHNPSSQHRAGEQAAEALERARESVAKLINAAMPKEIVFTSGGTESINHAIKGVALANAEKGKHIITSNIEHNAVIRSLRRLKSASFNVTSLSLDGTGRVNPQDIADALSDETVLKNDIIFMAIGVKPSRLFEDSGLPTGRDGGMLVNQYLQCVSRPEIFGGGDCISFEPQPLAKVGVYAVRQNPILLHNLLSTLNGHELQPFVPQKSILLALNLGDGTAIVHWHAMVWGGRLGFALKDYIDRKFMRLFQVSGELG